MPPSGPASDASGEEEQVFVEEGYFREHALHKARRHRPLTMLPLVALIFYEVSGGPFGIEDSVSSGGPLLAILGFLILPLVWSVPEALVTAELGTTFPENSGYVAWVTAAFGPFWGCLEGFLSWLCGVTDNAVYPVLFLSYLEGAVPSLASGWPRAVFLTVFSLGLSYFNYRGLHVVGQAAVGMTAFILAPFVIMCVMALPQVQPSNWFQQDWGAVDWWGFINVMFWNLNYWDSISTLIGEVENPTRTVPRALGGAVLLVILTYLLPLLVGLGITLDSSDWKLGYFTQVAGQVGGSWLAWWVIVAAACSQIGQYQAELSSDSYQVQGMAERGFLPKVFATRSRHDTPTLGIILSSAGIVMLANFNFQEIVELLNSVYCVAELLEFAAFLWLRIKLPHLYRPFRVPLPTWAAALMLLPASMLLATLLVLPIVLGQWQVVAWTSGSLVVGSLLYPTLQALRRLGWCKFVDMTPRQFSEGLYRTVPTTEEEAIDALDSFSVQ